MKLSYQFLIVSALVLIAVLLQMRKKGNILSGDKFNLEQHLSEYESVREALAIKQQKFKKSWNSAPTASQKTILKEARSLLVKTIPTDIFSYWYGTKWDFNGTTQTPRKGSIACGYFVSTTLEQSGFKLPRIKMAQQAASVMIKSLCLPSSIKTYTNMPDLERYLRDKPSGLFILGLDKHVGYILKQDDKCYFIHSTVAQGRKVVKEDLMEAKVVNRSKIKMIGDLTGSDAIIKAWIEGEFLALKP
jgi:hypothetical protein